MKFITFAVGGTTRLGVLQGDAVVPVIGDIQAIIAGGPAALAEIEAQVAAGSAAAVPLADVDVLAPIERPLRNIFCVGKNYYDHAIEFHSSGFDASAGKDAQPEFPIIFTKASTTVAAPGSVIPGHLDPTASVDYEGELAVVIGKGGRGIAKAKAMEHVFGYTIVNDVTSRTLQNRHRQWFIGKNLDGFCPMGPTLVTADEVPDVGALQLVTAVNGEVRQNASVSQLIFDIPTIIETISATMTLEPGDIIATGTCAGVGIGFDPPRFLQAGDAVAVTIEPIGVLENSVG
ncbi:fumarylacetoacetate hydrolase family protein [Novosphingobium resinovorum]|uniref:5-oxopent-3-ene-1,2,5-tricarboxylate decarboxylase n=1 Tax=Novosphingobium resinovorum TaxID=158500 RepID=A0A031JSI4_9SPHN|nr:MULTISPECIES: fumarylacetoacetate hydrolase family protein [Novosphingobium]AOR79232.1 hydrolase [Novosphingobium resinovorum]EZP79763.1 5-oxopent-3-ene-1,2,5-tricarboxylate decarboxylase [Novosphingobium resinovorum]MBF7014870.1 fumarylacetoacetate hydrolase family protein [Novosphingobium sp. HR1a]WJM24653.1 fumarylacetoacetate hydrolase family protein [Novosphingobium resinovorum]